MAKRRTPLPLLKTDDEQEGIVSAECMKDLSKRIGQAIAAGGEIVLHYAAGQIGAVKVIERRRVPNTLSVILAVINDLRTPGFHGSIRVHSDGKDSNDVLICKEECIGRRLLTESVNSD